MKKYRSIGDFIADYTEKQGDYYFSYETLKFFGIPYSSMKVLQKPGYRKNSKGEIKECYILSFLANDPLSSRKKRQYDYFDIKTLERII